MNQSARLGDPASSTLPFHVAIIMDGSGRWARARGLARAAGHRAGTSAVSRVIQAAPDCGIGTLTLHAFSSNNWGRPGGEVRALFETFEEFLRHQTGAWRASGIRLNVFGRRDRLPERLLAAILAAEAATARGTRLHLRLAIDYSSREALHQAAQALNGPFTAEELSRQLAASAGEPEAPPDVDLLIRTGGELRLSDFMVWECAYAELYFTPRLWPDFTAEDLRAAVREFHARDRRFGRIPESVAV
ncbi:MAG: polyprenyl diphosphate synthase [Acidobacteria bacterium]|nr:polyprenyl diphosphate synthase [Acidobacteriota bacterium]